MKEKILNALREVIDPELGMNVVDLDLILDIQTKDNGEVYLKFRPTSPYCPIAVQLAYHIKSAVEGIEGVKKACVIITEHTLAEFINEELNKEGECDSFGINIQEESSTNPSSSDEE